MHILNSASSLFSHNSGYYSVFAQLVYNVNAIIMSYQDSLYPILGWSMYYEPNFKRILFTLQISI